MNVNGNPYCETCGRKAFIQSKLSKNAAPSENGDDHHREVVRSKTHRGPVSPSAITPIPSPITLPEEESSYKSPPRSEDSPYKAPPSRIEEDEQTFDLSLPVSKVRNLENERKKQEELKRQEALKRQEERKRLEELKRQEEERKKIE